MKTKNTILAAATLLLLGACQETNKQGNETGSADTAVLKDHDGDKSTVTINDIEGNQGNAAPTAWSWDGMSWESPIVKYDEVTERDVEVRGNDDYGIYSLEEKVLFDLDKSKLKPTAQKHLDQIVASINKRYPNAHIGIFGFADNTGGKEDNKELSEQRANAVKEYLVSNGRIDASRLSVEGYGEKRPVASNETAAGRAKNRRVQIVAKK